MTLQEQYTTIWQKHGAFFAFGEKQFNEQRKEGVKYTGIGAGLTVPTENAQAMLEEMKEVTARARAEELATLGKDVIILRELRNHEAFYTGTIDSTVEALEGYSITSEEVMAVYKRELPNEDY